MKTLIVGCRTIENELEKTIQKTGVEYDVVWVESGLHNVPKMLNAAIQDILDKTTGYSLALLAMGYCGNSLSGLCSSDKILIIPRVDDCISLLIGSYKKRIAVADSASTYFLTPGWLKGERTIWHEYEYSLEKYGKETADSIFEMMLGHYKYLALLDTDCFDKLAAKAEVMGIARKLKLRYREIPGTLDYLIRLLTGPWSSDDFLVIPPGAVVTTSALTMA